MIIKTHKRNGRVVRSHSRRKSTKGSFNGNIHADTMREMDKRISWATPSKESLDRPRAHAKIRKPSKNKIANREYLSHVIKSSANRAVVKKATAALAKLHRTKNTN